MTQESPFRKPSPPYPFRARWHVRWTASRRGIPELWAVALVAVAVAVAVGVDYVAEGLRPHVLRALLVWGLFFGAWLVLFVRREPVN